MSNPALRLTVFFDGTDNTPKDRTNVWRAHELLADKDGEIEQKKLYVQGVGTEFGELASGSIFGVGVGRKIREGYEWLAKNYVDGAEIYIFGFSRGAFTARSLVQMIATCGLTNKDTLSDWTAKDAFDRYEEITRQAEEAVRPIWRLRRWKSTPAEAPQGWQPDAVEAMLLDDAKIRYVKVRMAGLWDTVGAIGTDALKNRDARIQKSAEHNVRPTALQEYGYHALAIDEHRPMFQCTLWRTFLALDEAQEKMASWASRYEQRWFVGAHSDVGGGYGDDRLPDQSLQWMLEKASGLGLAFTYRVEPEAGDFRAPVHDSFEAFAGGILSLWNDLKPGDQRFYRTIGREPRDVEARTGTAGKLWSINETLDDSVLRRWKDDPAYRPPSLIEYFKRNPGAVPAGSTAGQRTARIYANRYWNETGVYLRADTRYRARVVPNIGEPLRDDKFVVRGIAGEEWGDFAHKAASLVHGKRKDDAKWFALIGTVDRKQPQALTDGGEFQFPVGGQLQCYFNDVQLEIFYKNNSGWVVLEIEEV